MPLRDISEEWRTLKEGTYQLFVYLHDKEVFRETFYVTHNDKKEINVPPLFVGNIGVNVRLPSSTLGPEQSLRLSKNPASGHLTLFQKAFLKCERPTTRNLFTTKNVLNAGLGFMSSSPPHSVSPCKPCLQKSLPKRGDGNTSPHSFPT